jgi:pyruvate carboxylase subunit B
MLYEVAVTDSTKKVLAKYIKAGSAIGAGEGAIKAPMPGMIVKLYVEEGMHVMKDDKVVIVEAMKMENVLKSPVSGTVKSIKVKEGSAVDKNAVLIEIEPVKNA